MDTREHSPIHHACACRCGASRFTVIGQPIGRAFCHCTLCQAQFKQPYTDLVAMWARSVVLPAQHGIVFKKHRLPPAARRGECPICHRAVLGLMTLGPLKMAFISVQNFAPGTVLPEPGQHIFYHRRQNDVVDDLPKITGYWSSEAAILKMFLADMLR
ncbi:GFA family protein [Glaciimonas sp. GG7]